MNGIPVTIAIGAAGLALLAGCQQPAPRLEGQFGSAVRQAIAQQIIDPTAGLKPEPVDGMDGPAARQTIERYEKTFETPPPAVNVINIGGSLGGGK